MFVQKSHMDLTITVLKYYVYCVCASWVGFHKAKLKCVDSGMSNFLSILFLVLCFAGLALMSFSYKKNSFGVDR